MFYPMEICAIHLILNMFQRAPTEQGGLPPQTTHDHFNQPKIVAQFLYLVNIFWCNRKDVVIMKVQKSASFYPKKTYSNIKYM